MCGIAGYFGRDKSVANKLDRVCERLYRRGPDFQAHRTFVFGPNLICLAHTRLSIIDLDPRSHQPFEANGFTIIFNGELYNYRELKLDLEREGYNFNTNSDTEVFLAGYQKHGIACFKHYEGMWAAAIYEQSTGTLLITRDRFGEKPIFYHTNADGFYFASDVPTLIEFTGRHFSIDYDQVKRNLTCGFRSRFKTGHTFFKEVSIFPRACLVQIDANTRGQIKFENYWKPSFSQDQKMDTQSAITGIRDRLLRSLKIRLRADVPLAFCLSGGVDSAGLVSLSKKLLNYQVHGFSIIDSDPRYNERNFIDAVVTDCSIDCTLIDLSTSHFIERLTDLVKYRATPIATISYYVHALLMEAVQQHGYKVVLSGTGADELFTGYYDHFLLHALHAKNAGSLDQARAAWSQHIAPLVRTPELADYNRYIDYPIARNHLYENQTELESYLVNPFHEDFQETEFCADLLRNRMANEMFYEIVPVILQEDDANSMYYSLENRSPFLDRELFDFANSIPSKLLIQNGFGKFLLREALKGILCEPVRINREKRGFNASILSVFDTRNPDLVDWLLAPGPLLQIVSKPALAELLRRDHFPNSLSKFLFSVINTKIFLETFE